MASPDHEIITLSSSDDESKPQVQVQVRSYF